MNRVVWVDVFAIAAAELQTLQRHEVKSDYFEHGLARLSLVETVDIDAQTA